MCGTLIAWGFAAALGDATWSVSTGLGSCFVSAIYEVGRPDRLSSDEAQELEDKYADFGASLHMDTEDNWCCQESHTAYPWHCSWV